MFASCHRSALGHGSACCCSPLPLLVFKSDVIPPRCWHFFFSKAQQGGMWLTWHLGPLGVGYVSWKIRIIHLFWYWANDIRFSLCQKKCCVWLLRIYAENGWSKELHQTPRYLSVCLSFCVSARLPPVCLSIDPSVICLCIIPLLCIVFDGICIWFLFLFFFFVWQNIWAVKYLLYFCFIISKSEENLLLNCILKLLSIKISNFFPNT